MIIVRDPPPDPDETDPSFPPTRPPFAFAASAASTTSADPSRPADIRFTPEPCLVCGAPLGSCTDDDHQLLRDHTRQVMRTKEVQRAMRHDTRLQGTTDANRDPSSNLFVVPEDVVEEYVPPAASRPSWRLIHHKGEVITKERAAQLGLIDPADVPPPSAVPSPSARTVVVEGPPVTPTQQ